MYKLYLRKVIGALLASATLLTSAASAFAQEWPTRSIRIIVFGPAGASTDIVARILANELAPLVGQPVLVDNRPGGAAAPAVKEMNTLPRDGHTIMLAISSLVTELPHSAKLQYNPQTDLTPIANVAGLKMILVGNNNVQAKNVPDLVKLVKANPNKFNYASFIPGTLPHVMGLQLNQAAVIDMTHIGFKGGTFAMQAVLAGDVQVSFDAVANALQLVKTGKIHPYAVSGPARSAMLPNVPTFRETGYPQLEESLWFPLWVPPEVPRAVQAKIRAAVLKAMDKDAVRAKLFANEIQPGSDARRATAGAPEGRERRDREGAQVNQLQTRMRPS